MSRLRFHVHRQVALRHFEGRYIRPWQLWTYRRAGWRRTRPNRGWQ